MGVGSSVGVAVGSSVGVAVGSSVGVAVGFSVGVAVGSSVGVAVGSSVGVAVGSSVGVIVDPGIGVLVGVELDGWVAGVTNQRFWAAVGVSGGLESGVGSPVVWPSPHAESQVRAIRISRLAHPTWRTPLGSTPKNRKASIVRPHVLARSTNLHTRATSQA